MVGVPSERDIVRGASTHCEQDCSLEARTVINRDVVTCWPRDSLEAVPRFRCDQRRPYMPIIDCCRLAGQIDISDLLWYPVNSVIDVPQGPGLGVEPDPVALEQFAGRPLQKSA